MALILLEGLWATSSLYQAFLELHKLSATSCRWALALPLYQSETNPFSMKFLGRGLTL